MTHEIQAMLTAANLLAWTAQAFLLVLAGSLLPMLLRIRHPWTRLAYYHALLLLCLALPVLQPWRHPVTGADEALAPPLLYWPQLRWVLWALPAGVLARLCWLLGGLWRVRQHRIASMPLYPVPESVRAATALTQADALFCLCQEVPGPVMLGWLAPVILLPASFLALGEEAQCGIASHELLHVRRHDWLMTVLEELLGALLWFNPAVWLLLAQTRLAREQLVDAEAVRLTASREPYIEALLAIARHGSRLDLAPAPLFLRRRHLTQRVHSLLKDAPVSPARLAASYFSIAAILGLAGWSGAAAFPLTGQSVRLNAAAAVSSQSGDATAAEIKPAKSAAPALPDPLASAPVPTDPRELVNGGVKALASPDSRAAALGLLERARQNARLHTPSAPPYRFDSVFTAYGNALNTGPGQLSEIRASGRSWRWTVDLGGYSLARVADKGRTLDQPPVSAIPMRAQTLREAILWSLLNWPPGARIRSAEALWNGQPVTCLLLSNGEAKLALTGARLWEEDEYCIDPVSGFLQIYSIAPGTYFVYGYSRHLQFHGQQFPDHISIYANGAMVADADFTIADMSAADESLLTPAPEMVDATVLAGNVLRLRLNAPSPVPFELVQPVIVHAQIDGEGKVVEEELSAAADLALAQPALDLVKRSAFPRAARMQRQAYINVRFMPATANQ